MSDSTARLTMNAFQRCALAVVLCMGAVAVYAQNPDQVKQLLATKQCQNCDLQSAQIVGANLNRGNLSGSDLSGAFLYRSTLRNAELQNAKFTGADLSGADLSGAQHADLTGAVTDEHTTCPNGKAGPCK